MNYEFAELLGEGTYGKVFRAVKKNSNGETSEVAIKRIKATTTLENSELSSDSGGLHFTTVREIKIMKSISHRNLVHLIDVFKDSDDQIKRGGKTKSCSLNLVMPYLKTDLKQLIADRSIILSMASVKCIIRQVLSGLEALHSNWFLHRDLAPANVMIDISTGICMIGDFGLARSFGMPYPGLLGRRRTFAGVMTSEVVTRWYRSPELLLGANQYGIGVDIWAAGCIFAELLPRIEDGSRTPLFPGTSELDQLQRIFELLGTPSESVWKESFNFPKVTRFTHLPEQPDWASELFSPSLESSSPGSFHFLNSMISLDPNRRMSATDLLASDFFTTSIPRPCTEITLCKQVLRFLAQTSSSKKRLDN